MAGPSRSRYGLAEKQALRCNRANKGKGQSFIEIKQGFDVTPKMTRYHLIMFKLDWHSLLFVEKLGHDWSSVFIHWIAVRLGDS